MVWPSFWWVMMASCGFKNNVSIQGSERDPPCFIFKPALSGTCCHWFSFAMIMLAYLDNLWNVKFLLISHSKNIAWPSQGEGVAKENLPSSALFKQLTLTQFNVFGFYIIDCFWHKQGLTFQPGQEDYLEEHKPAWCIIFSYCSLQYNCWTMIYTNISICLFTVRICTGKI